MSKLSFYFNNKLCACLVSIVIKYLLFFKSKRETEIAKIADNSFCISLETVMMTVHYLRTKERDRKQHFQYLVA